MSSKLCSSNALRRRVSRAAGERQPSVTAARASSQNARAEGEGAETTWWMGAVWRAPPWLMMNVWVSEEEDWRGMMEAQWRDMEATNELRWLLLLL